jgi:hypothetical protein
LRNPITGIAAYWPMPACCSAGLQDHLQVRMQYRCTERITMNDVIHSWRHRAGAGLRYALFRKGLLAVPVFTCYAQACRFMQVHRAG